jgi:hypothetical protein
MGLILGLSMSSKDIRGVPVDGVTGEGSASGSDPVLSTRRRDVECAAGS